MTILPCRFLLKVTQGWKLLANLESHLEWEKGFFFSALHHHLNIWNGPIRKTQAKKDYLKLKHFHQRKNHLRHAIDNLWNFPIWLWEWYAEVENKQLNCSTSRQSEPLPTVLWFPHLTRSFKHRRCSSSHNSLRGIHPVTTTHTFHSNILLGSSSTDFYYVLTFPNNIYGQLGIYMLLFKQYKAVWVA